MNICQQCGTDQVQRIKHMYRLWRVHCKCRRCGYYQYDSWSYTEWLGTIESRIVLGHIHLGNGTIEAPDGSRYKL